MVSDEIELLKHRVTELENLVKKQSVLLSKTGQSVMELQVKNQKDVIEGLDQNYLLKGSVKKIDTSDFATNDDLVQLVGELQGQLDIIEDRSLRRVINSTKRDKGDLLAPLPNADGEFPDAEEGIFPRTLGDFEKLDKVTLYRLAKFYELIAPSLMEREKFEDFLEGKIENFHIDQTLDECIQKEVSELCEDRIFETFNDVARYFGIISRKGASAF